MHARNSISLAQSPQDQRQPNFKNVRNIEIKDKIAKINEENGSEKNNLEKADDDQNQEPASFMNNTDHLDKVIKEEYTSQLENKPDIYNVDG
jgi:flagellar motility protein MotE (MotC chaperone)